MDFYMKLAASHSINREEEMLEEENLTSRTDDTLRKIAAAEKAGRELAKTALAFNPAGLAGKAMNFAMRNPRLATGAVGAGAGYMVGGEQGAMMGGLAGGFGGVALRNAAVGKNPLMGQGVKDFAQKSLRANPMKPMPNSAVAAMKAPVTTPAPAPQRALPPARPSTPAPAQASAPQSVVVDPTWRNLQSRGSIQSRGAFGTRKTVNVVPGTTMSGVSTS